MSEQGSKHFLMLEELKDAQKAETDNREMVREATHFLNKRDGQWEPKIIQKFSGKPRYTFDECNPIVDDIMGEMEAMNFDVRVTAAGAGSSKETAKQFEGIIRTIENISRAQSVYLQAAKIMVGTGMDGWRVVQEYRDDDHFQQDLLIKKVPNFVDSVWFDQDAVEPDMSDSMRSWVLTSMSKAKYKKEYPNGSCNSIGSGNSQQAYSYKKSDEVVIGEYLYKVKKSRELVLMTNGSIYEVNDDFKKVQDELKKAGVTVHKQRTRDYYEVHSRFFDGDDWLDEASKTVFCYIPVVPIYGNFIISESKVVYWGVTEKIMDAQRVINYAESRKIEEGALSPRGKYWLTNEQAQSAEVRRTLRTLNTNMDPVQFYDFAEGHPPPAYQGAPASNPGLVETSQSAQGFIERTSGTFDEARGAAPAHRSGEAVGLLQKKSDNPKRKWFKSVETGIAHTGRILVKAIPKVYDTQQEMVLTHQNGSTEVITIRQKVRDEQTQEVVELNDLSKGMYDVLCKAGPAFHSQQQETVTTITDIAGIDPSIIQLGADVLLNNINAPGIDQLAERKRLLMVMQGMIPPNQMTDEERKLVAQQNQNQEMSPLDQANLMIAQAQLQETQGKNQERAVKLELEQQKVRLKEIEISLKQQLEGAKISAQREQQLVDAVTAVVNQIKTQAETLNLIREGMGADAILDKSAVGAYQEQAEQLETTISQQ